MFEYCESYSDFIGAIACERSEQERMMKKYVAAVNDGNDALAERLHSLAGKHFSRAFEIVYEAARYFDAPVSRIDCDAEDYNELCRKAGSADEDAAADIIRRICDEYEAREEDVRSDIDYICE